MESGKIDPRLREFNRLLLESDGIYREAARRLGVSSCMLWILYTMRMDGEPISQTQLCEILYEPKTTVNSCLKQMEAQGLIVMDVGCDRRTRHISMTGKGRALAEETADRLLCAEEAALLDMPPELRAGFLLGFRKYNQNLLKQLDPQNLMAVDRKKSNSEEEKPR